MKPATFSYTRADSVAEAVKILAEAGDGARILAGGQSLVPLLNLRFSFPELLVDINHIPDLDYIREAEGSVRVGALVRQSQLGNAAVIRDQVPMVASAIPHIGHFVTRNRGTVAGSLAHSDSRAELPVVLVALGGSVVAISTSGQRGIPAAELFVSDFTTSLAPGEIIAESIWPILGDGWGISFKEFALRHGDYALGMVAVAVHVRDGVVDTARVVAGSVADRPLLLEGAGLSLTGKRVDDAAADAAADSGMGAVDPVGDAHASGDYKRHLVGVLIDSAVREAWKEANGG